MKCPRSYNDFVWLTEDYCVNMSNVFSMQRVRIEQDGLVEKYKEDYERLIKYFSETRPPLLYGDDLEEVEINESSSQEDIKKYSLAVESAIMNELGPMPEPYKYEHIIILATGVKVQVTPDKYEMIKNKTLAKDDYRQNVEQE